ncbi:MAG: hypothetical protein CEN90_271 [Parcubacteria group bacterium Licking1014_17]|nr:MAG: hypothetical protein CEN90_271 [Parcubacteria group bacterium Licking1014_17]
MEFHRDILGTLAYFDVFDYPLTAEEIGKFMMKVSPVVAQKPADIKEAVDREMEYLLSAGLVGEREGCFFLGGKEYLAPLREKRRLISLKKRKILSRGVRWLRHVPYIRAVFVAGSVAMNNCEEIGDIDILIVTAKDRIWLARFFESVLLSLLRIRRIYKHAVSPNKICPNHYLAEDGLKIPFEGVYNAMTYATMAPVISSPGIVEKFREENIWIKKFVRWLPETGRGRSPSFVSKFFEIVLSPVSGYLNQAAKNYQIGRIEKHRRWDKGGHIIYSDKQLAFHPYSVEKSVEEKFQKQMADMNKKGNGLPFGDKVSHF